jgi:hypothetical protein
VIILLYLLPIHFLQIFFHRLLAGFIVGIPKIYRRLGAVPKVSNLLGSFFFDRKIQRVTILLHSEPEFEVTFNISLRVECLMRSRLGHLVVLNILAKL